MPSLPDHKNTTLEIKKKKKKKMVLLEKGVLA